VIAAKIACQGSPKLLAPRLYDMVRARGFAGSVRTVREHVALVRPRPPREAYLLTETLPGEVAQVDWAHAGEIAVPGGVRALWLFVIVLANSRAMWGEFVIDLTVHSLCRSLVRAGRAFGGVARQWLFDNPKVVVLERIGTVARFHPTLLALCAAMRVEPKLCAVRKPRQKGKVERAIDTYATASSPVARSPVSTRHRAPRGSSPDRARRPHRRCAALGGDICRRSRRCTSRASRTGPVCRSGRSPNVRLDTNRYSSRAIAPGFSPCLPTISSACRR
jgi:transposase